MTDTTERYEPLMRHALALAARGPATGVNPQVGCVLVDDSGAIVAEGWHRGAGTSHAEVDALSKIADAHGLTAVVTLEPCNHTGRTGPCSEALIAAGIERVVYSASDPNPRAGGGAERLASAGIEVVDGLLSDETEVFMHPWLTSARLGRPYVTVKWASSLDGRAAAADGTSQWITGEESRHDVHLRRSLSDAIVVGTGTVLADDPALTARNSDGSLMQHQPLAVVIGERTAAVGARITEHPGGFVAESTHDLSAVLANLYSRDIRRVFVEGGPTLASSFVAANLVDEYLIYVAPTLLGGDRLALGEIGVGTISDQRRLRIESIERLGEDLRVVARPTAGEK